MIVKQKCPYCRFNFTIEKTGAKHQEHTCINCNCEIFFFNWRMFDSKYNRLGISSYIVDIKINNKEYLLEVDPENYTEISKYSEEYQDYQCIIRLKNPIKVSPKNINVIIKKLLSLSVFQ